MRLAWPRLNSPTALRWVLAILVSTAGAALVSTVGVAVAGSIPGVGTVFTPRDMAAWDERNFAGRTEYEVVEMAGREALEARCDNAGSALYLDREVDLRETPVMEWSWQVEGTFGADIDESVKAGDDFPARVYVVVDGGLMRWRTRAVTYVWSSATEKLSDWPNPYASQARMVAMRSGPPEQPGKWKNERRNVRKDFRRFHGRDLDAIDGVALMTDCDDLESTARAWYGEIRFVPE